MLRKYLFSPDPPFDGGPAPEPTPAPTPTPTAPPAAAGVIGGKTEREIELEKKFEQSEAARKKAETDASYLADQNRQLKEVPTKPAKKSGSGWVFPDEE